MSITMEERVIKVIDYRQEPGDHDYGTCLWATFAIDAGRRSLDIQSDGGNMQYTWGNIGDASPEGFFRFLAKLDRDYLLTKMSEQKCFNFDATIERLCAYHQGNDHPVMARRVSGMHTCFYVHEFASEYMALYGSHSDDLECLVMDYPRGHQAVADIFCKHVQPLLRDYVASLGQTGQN